MMKRYSQIGRWVCLAVAILLAIGLGAQTVKRRIVEHIVAPGDTVYSIAQRYGVSVERVYELNSWARSSIKQGDKLLILTSDAYAPVGGGEAKRTPTRTEHTISAGETLYRIARLYSVSEEALMRANPGISADNFPIGTTLRIPVVGGQATVLSETIPARSVVRVLLMLPLVKTARYLEFYRGFLMGMNDLKKDGISINLKVLDAEDDDAVAGHIASGAMHMGYDLVIGGVTERQIAMLSSALRQGYYVVPFASQIATMHPRLIRINQQPQEVAGRAADRIAQLCRGRELILVSPTDEDRSEPLVGLLRSRLEHSGGRVRTVTLGRDTSLGYLASDAVVVPTVASREFAEQILRALGNSSASLIGYPQWQSYGQSFVRALHMRGATIYSSFYYDLSTNESKLFATKYNAWFNRRMSNDYPKYSVMGYDLARYFIRAQATLGSSFAEEQELLAGDGLQIDINLEPERSGQGYVNRGYYLITYNKDGSVSRTSY